MNWTRISSIVIVGFTAIGAIYGGLSMVFMPSGGLLSLSTGLLDGSPFVDYLVPGIFLFVFVGLFHLAALIYLLKKLPRTKEVMFAAAAVLAEAVGRIRLAARRIRHRKAIDAPVANRHDSKAPSPPPHLTHLDA